MLINAVQSRVRLNMFLESIKYIVKCSNTPDKMGKFASRDDNETTDKKRKHTTASRCH